MLDQDRTSFAENEDGAVAAIYAVSLFALIAIAGVGYDYARMAGMHSELQNAADQAALAGASQLDQNTNTCSRAATAASNLLTNETLLGRLESGSLAVTIDLETTCDAVGDVRFWQDEAKTTASTSDSNANFIEVIVNGRTADYALTPIIGLFNSGSLDASAMAGVSSAICDVPPLMVCMPPTGVNTLVEGMGIRATSHSAGNAWGPGDFGFLEIGAGSIQDLAKALAYEEVPLDCAPADGTLPETGNAQMLYEAINTRLDIYPQGNDAPLNVCLGGACPAAANSIKDLVNTSAASNANQCRIGNSGWQLPTNRFSPAADDGSDPTTTPQDADGAIDAMGYSRDLCHYNSYNAPDCNGDLTVDQSDRFGSTEWPLADYFKTNHPTAYNNGTLPNGYKSWTRYETYLWEQGLLKDSSGSEVQPVASAVSTAAGQQQAPICGVVGDPTTGLDRRLLTVAVVTNCSSLAGGSTEVDIGAWFEMFLVEPIVDDNVERANGRGNDEVYLELVRKTTIGTGSGGAGSQGVRRDVPYLVR